MVSEVSCPHADRCPGCALIHEPYAAQLEHKAARVRRAFGRHPLLASVEIEAVAPAEPIVGYRRRAKLPVHGARIGAYARGSHEVIDIPECRVLAEPIARALDALRALLSKPSPDARAVFDALIAVDARVASDSVLLTLVVDREAKLDSDALIAAGNAVLGASSDVVGVAVSEGSAKGPTLLGGAPRTIAGQRELAEPVGGAVLLAVPGAFVQVHAGQSARIATIVAEHVRSVLGGLSGKRVLDLYGGSGAIGLSLAGEGAEVGIVEAYAPAADAARRAAQTQDLCARVIAEDVARFLAGQRSLEQAIVVNPPRRGVPPEVRAKIAASAAQAVAYVSCNPETLARDLAHLALFGLKTTRALPLDMIPLTEEVETVALLSRGPIPLPSVIFEDAELVVIDKPPHEPTTPQGEHAGSLLERVRALAGCDRAAPLHRLDATTSGVNIFAKTPEAFARWAGLWSQARKRYRALAVGITRAKGVVNRALFADGKQRAARTRFVRLEVVGGHSLLDVFPDQGRKHQIRRHLAGLGHAVVGDARHGHRPTNRHFAEAHGLDRSFLHCARIDLGEHVFEAPLAADLGAVLDSLSSRAER